MPYLTETLASIAAQTYSNAQIFVWDNGSTDGTLEELSRWIPSKLPGRVFADEPLPLGASRARLVSLAPTEFCAWIDADDLNVPHRLERQVEFLLAHPRVAAVGSHILVIDSTGSPSGVVAEFPLADDGIVLTMLKGPGLAQPAVLFRRSTVLDVGNYHDVGSVHVEDYDLWLRLATRYQLANLDEVLLHYRVHDESTTVRSERQGLLAPAATQRFLKHGPALYGCSRKEAELLVERRHRLAVLPFFRIARRLQQRSGVGILATLRSPEFLLAARAFVASEDLFSRFALRVLDPKRPSLQYVLRSPMRKLARWLLPWRVQR